ncbi:MAG: cell division protein FtsZ [Chitinophagales bacterium]
MIFDIPKEQSSIIKVIGVGGGGSNAVNHMFMQGIKDVNFVICNTDHQALEMSPVPNKIQLGPTLTKGRGAGSHPSVGQNATMESLQEIKALLEKNTEMVFITAGMGGGTGTGGAPVIAKLAKEMGILTIGIVTVPFGFEGKRRKSQAFEGLETLKHYVDAILIVSNDKLREMFGNLAWNEAFAKADDILTTAAKGIAEIITVPGYVNVDFEDVKTVLRDSGLAIMGSGSAEGTDRALNAVISALESPLLNDNDIRGARNILLNISSGIKPVLMDEIAEITDYVQDSAGNDCDIIWGNCTDESLGDKLMVTVIATGFETIEQRNHRIKQNTYKITHINTNELINKKEVTTNNEIDNDVAVDEPQYKIKLKGETKYEEKPIENKEANPMQFSFDFDLYGNTGEVINEQNADIPVGVPEEINSETPITEIVAENIEADAIVYDEPKEEIKMELKEEIKPVEEKKDEPVFEIKKETREHHSDSVVKKEEVKPVVSKVEPQSLITNEDKMGMVNNQSNDRINRLKSMSMKLSNSNLDEIEKVPAYLRRNVDLEETPDARETNLSKYNLVDGDNGPELKKNNSFLHDNVD